MNTYHLMVRKDTGGLSHVEVKARNYTEMAERLDKMGVPFCDVRLVMTSSEYWKAYDRALSIVKQTESYRKRSLK